MRNSLSVRVGTPAPEAIVRFALLLIVGLVAPVRLTGQDPLPSEVTFSLRRSWLDSLLTGGPGGRTVGTRWQATMRLGERSNVHAIASDCELHVAAKMPNNKLLASPAGIVVEPPNVCKRRVPEINQGGAIAEAWRSYFDANVVNKTCTVTGFPRIFSEHAAAGGEDAPPSNPDHVIEIHPVTRMECNGSTIDYIPLVRIFPSMRKISDASARTCIEERRLFVRQRGSGDQIKYEFSEEGAKGSGGRCGNFVAVDAHFDKEYLRELTNGGDHAALARVWVGEDGPFPLKIYTYSGTPVDARLKALFDNPDSTADLQLAVHGVLTYDYFTIAQHLQDENFQWLPAAQLRDFKEIRRPLALVVFGTAEP
jgi:hypothetical protein